ncbi:hypothetical protein QHH11_02645 [Aphanizomenon sp. PH219]|nr:hypothetical protein [Aphanizomenon sp. 202]MDK2458049.1 hypothetical protein [Aphanizomenon sp. PH219]
MKFSPFYKSHFAERSMSTLVLPPTTMCALERSHNFLNNSKVKV